MRPIGAWPYRSNTHKNGDYFLGLEPSPVQPLYDAGTPPVSILFRKSVTSAVGEVRIGDVLPVDYDGEKYWWARTVQGDTVGRLTWSGDWYSWPISASLHVQRLLLNSEGDVVNLNGYAAPR